MDDTSAKIKHYLKVINNHTDAIDESVIDFVITEVLDRVQLYLNSDTIPAKLERILANIVNTNLTRCIKGIDNNAAVERAITSISDNGQSISYSNEVERYFTSVSDEELFTGFTSLLSRYRRVKVVYPAKHD